MSKTFDELFDDFFKKDNKTSDKTNGNAFDNVKEEAKKMLDMLTNFDDVENIDEAVEKEIDATLGKPDKIEFYNEGELFIERRTWNTPNGDLVKLIISDDPTLRLAPVPEKSLQQKLDEAVAAEEFEKAAAIRDEIKKINKDKKNAK